ncbi:LysR substrate-binding domain-containing protein [Streptomyces sp. NPDC001108]
MGFQGTVDDYLAQAIALFEEEHPGCALELTEIPLSDPFGPVRRQEVDCAVVLLPVQEEDLVLGPVFSRQPQTLAVSARHPFAARESVSAEELADCRLISVGAGDKPGPAPAYWRLTQAPDHTPKLRPIPAGPLVNTLQEGLSLAAANRGTMLLCRSTADYHGRRSSVTFVPVDGLPPRTGADLAPLPCPPDRPRLRTGGERHTCTESPRTLARPAADRPATNGALVTVLDRRLRDEQQLPSP